MKRNNVFKVKALIQIFMSFLLMTFLSSCHSESIKKDQNQVQTQSDQLIKSQSTTLSNNLALNPGMETANGTRPASWVMGSQEGIGYRLWERRTSTPPETHSGSAYGRLVFKNGSGKWGWIITERNISVTPGSTIRVDAYFRANMPIQLQVREFNSSGAEIVTRKGNIMQPGQWAWFSYMTKTRTADFRLNSQTTQIQVAFLCQSGTKTSDYIVDIDDVSVNVVGVAPTPTPTPRPTPTPTPTPRPTPPPVTGPRPLPDVPGNLALNPNMELVSGNRPLHWSEGSYGVGSLSLQSVKNFSDSRTGDYYTRLQAQNGTNNWAWITSNSFIPVGGFKALRVSAFIRSNMQAIQIEIQQYDGDYKKGTTIYGNELGNLSWQWLDFASMTGRPLYNLAGNTRYIKIAILGKLGSASTNYMDIDDVSVTGIDSITVTKTFNVATYGANGSDQIDDSQAVLSAIQALYQHGDKGAELYFPAGKYIISRSIGTSVSNLIVRGDGFLLGKPRTQIYVDFPTIDPSSIAFAFTGHNVLVKDLFFHSNPNAKREEEGILLYIGWGAYDVTVRNCRFENGTNFTILTQFAEDVAFINNDIVNSRSDGIHLTWASRRIHIIGNRFVNNGDDSIGLAWDGMGGSVLPDYFQNIPSGQRFSDLKASRYNQMINNIIIQDNTISRRPGAKINNANCEVRTPYGDSGAHGIHVGEGSRIVRVQNNEISNTTLSAIGIYDWHHINQPDSNERVNNIFILNNKLIDPLRFRLEQFGQANMTKFCGATLYDGHYQQYEDGKALGVWVLGATSVTIKGNHFSHTHAYNLLSIPIMGIMSNYSKNVTIQDNKFVSVLNNFPAIGHTASVNMNISNNQVTKSSYARPIIQSAGMGCTNSECLWLRGNNLNPSTIVKVYYSEWGSDERTYVNLERTFDNPNYDDQVTLKLNPIEHEHYLRRGFLGVEAVNPYTPTFQIPSNHYHITR